MQVLLRAYIRSNRQAIIPLLEGVNFCSFDDSQKLLASAGMESELIALYSTHHKHELVFPRFPVSSRQGDLSNPFAALQARPFRS